MRFAACLIPVGVRVTVRKRSEVHLGTWVACFANTAPDIFVMACVCGRGAGEHASEEERDAQERHVSVASYADLGGEANGPCVRGEDVTSGWRLATACVRAAAAGKWV